MRITTPELLEIIYLAVNEFNEMQEPEDQLEPAPGTLLYQADGKAGLEESELVNFLVTVDEILDENMETVGLPFNINHVLEQKESILKTLQTLAEHLVSLQKEEGTT